jgi:hypothetical protein
MWSSGGNMLTHFFNPAACCFLYKAKDLSAPRDWMYPANDRKKLKAIVNTVVILRIPNYRYYEIS